VVVNGFKGDLKKKLDFLKGAALVKQVRHEFQVCRLRAFVVT
jgi:hypothetical protein